MKYMLLTYLDENVWLKMSPAEQQREMDLCKPHVETLLEKKKLLAGAPLHPTSTATTLKNRGGKRLILDGPFAETREHLGGYAIIEADDLDDAIRIAAGFMGTSELASIEVRPIVELDTGVRIVPAE